MANRLSDRIAQASEDVLNKIIQTEMVQKMLMTGELDERDRKAALHELKSMYDIIEYYKTAKHLHQIDGLTAEETEFFTWVDVSAIQLYGKLLDEFREACGSVPNDINQRPVQKETENYFKFLDDLKETGSIVENITAYFAFYHLCGAVYKYLANNPSYKENNLAKLYLFETISTDTVTNQFKTYIDNRVNESDTDIEEELKITYRTVAETWLSGLVDNYQ